MKILGSRTILQLDVFGFLVVALPLIAALVIALMEVDELVASSRSAVFRSANTLQTSRILLEQATDMARNAQQYLVLGDEELYQLYRTRRAELEQTRTRLSLFEPDETQRRLLERLAVTERRLSESLERYAQAAQSGDTASFASPDFTELPRLARAVLLEGGRFIEREVNGVREQAAQLERTLLMHALATIPLALGLGAVFTFVIARPLRQLEHAIRRLGRGEFGAPIALTGARDLEELGRRLDWLRKRLVALEQQKVNFLRHVSHELKTPLATIREGAQLLGEQVVGPLNGRQLEVTEMLNESSLRLQKLIEDLLQFSVERPPRMDTQTRPLALDDLVQKVLADQKIAIAARRLKVSKDLDRIVVSGDPEQLRVIVDNLLSNAIKYSPRGGQLRIATHRQGGWAVLDVHDEGPGIAPEDRARIFEPFYRGRPAPPDTVEGAVTGTGLGLAIAREYVTLHDGVIEAVDAAQGAHLRLSVPLEPTAPAPLAPQAPARPGAP